MVDRGPWRVLACLIATGTLIGLSTNLAKLASDAGLGALAFLAWSIAGAAVLLVGIAIARRRRIPRSRRAMEYFTISGLVSLAAPNLLLFAAVPYVGPAFVVLALAFPPLYTYVGALLLRMERWDTRRALGVLLALAGAVVLAIAKLRAPNASVLWIVLTLVAPVLLAIGNIYRTARWPDDAEPEDLAPGMLGAAAILLLVFGWLAGWVGLSGAQFTLSVPVDSRAAWLILIGQTATLAVSYVLFFVLQKVGGPVYLSLLGSVAALTGVPFAVYVLGAALPQGLTLAGTLIAIGVALLTLSQRRER